MKSLFHSAFIVKGIQVLTKQYIAHTILEMMQLHCSYTEPITIVYHNQTSFHIFHPQSPKLLKTITTMVIALTSCVGRETLFFFLGLIFFRSTAGAEYMLRDVLWSRMLEVPCPVSTLCVWQQYRLLVK